MPKQDQYIDRPPRIQPELPTGQIQIPPPPRDDEQRQPLWQALIPVITIIGYVLASLGGQGQNPTFILPMVLSVFISTSIAIWNALSNHQRRIERIRLYRRRLSELRQDMVDSHNRQRTFYGYNYPDPDTVVQMRADKADNRSGTRLWERRATDDDFGVTRLGLGTRPSSVVYLFQTKEDGQVSTLDPEASRLASDSAFISNVPITLPLFQQLKQKTESQGDKNGAPDTDHQNILVKHLIAITGQPTPATLEQLRKDIYEFTYAAIAHYIAFHTPTDLELYILGMSNTEERWSWAYDLPHCTIDVDRGQYRLYFEDAERICVPNDCIVQSLSVKRGDVVSVNQELAKVISAGQTQVITSRVAGRVDEVNTLFFNPSTRRLEPEGKPLKKGDLLLRLRDFELSQQQLEEELDPQKGMQGSRGKERKREVAGAPRFWKEKIWAQLDKRASRMRDSDGKNDPSLRLPFMLIVVDLLQTDLSTDSTNPLKKSHLDDLESEAAMSLLAAQGAELGAAVIFLTSSRNRVPSSCQAVIELKRDGDNILKFLYAEVGLNSPRYVGRSDTLEDMRLSTSSQARKINQDLRDFVTELKHWKVRRSYGADIPTRVQLLSLYDVSTINNLKIDVRWEDSRVKTPEWPKIPLGMLAGQEPRNLHFFADADGVHGMIAGSTGSGKSELLMTMILSLAIKYDPSIVNFVLIDYKGGGTFDNFADLPHVVDSVNNLDKNAVARMFAAITAELDRRQRLNQLNKVKDIVRYRSEGYHLSKNENYPHLFIVIDEFAEMIANEPEYKAQLESITRLGRALGVSLILAAQRPSGVTDQMRSNIKFKLCLRVETREESSELLRRPDASYLPSIPGRGYLQVGNDSLELIQVGYTGDNYTASSFDDYEPFERYERQNIIWEDDLGRERDEPMYDVLVRRMANLKERHYPAGSERWRRPWPRPLPTYISLDSDRQIETSYILGDDLDDLYQGLHTDPDEPFSLAPYVMRRLKSSTPVPWPGVEWGQMAMRAFVGLIDDARSAKLRLLRVDFKQGHHVIFGTAGYGKSVFLQSVVTNLISSHSPSELHLYILDFGSRRFEAFKGVPHVGAWIMDHETDRVERLLRFLDQEIDTRKEIISARNSDNIYDYNQDPLVRTKMTPILVVIDNYAVFKENYENQIEFLTPIVRDGLSMGIHLLISAEQPGTIGKLFALFPQRITLKLSDESEYANIVGRGALPVQDIAGRGLQNIDRRPLEIQVAMPVGIDDANEEQTENERLALLLENISEAARDYDPVPQISRLPDIANLSHLIDHQVRLDGEEKRSPTGEDRVIFTETYPTHFILGQADIDLRPLPVTLQVKPHFVIVGPPSSGRTTTLQSIIISLAATYPPDAFAFVMIDPQQLVAETGGEKSLLDLPHSLFDHVLTKSEHIQELIKQLNNEFFTCKDSRPRRDVYVFIDHYERDDMDEMMGNTGDKPLLALGRLARNAGRDGLHFVVAGMADSLRSGDDLMRPICAHRHGLGMDYDSTESSPLSASLPRVFSQLTLPRGRGFYVYAGKGHLVQIALPYEAQLTKDRDMNDFIERIGKRWRDYKKAEWLPLREQAESSGKDGKAGKLSSETRHEIVMAYAAFMSVPEEDLDFTADRAVTMTDEDLLRDWVEAYKLTIPSLNIIDGKPASAARDHTVNGSGAENAAADTVMRNAEDADQGDGLSDEHTPNDNGSNDGVDQDQISPDESSQD